MSHLEDLEEYDAELELSLKHEYATVFGLFRYCVLTQEATYLCNVLDLSIEHQPSYPLFHLTMEDVWVWDKNRPSRIIPRADVHTTSDITVEELKPLDDVADDAPARLRRAAAGRTPDSFRSRPPDALSAGHEAARGRRRQHETVLGLFDGGADRRVAARPRAAAPPTRSTSSSPGCWSAEVVGRPTSDAACVSSTVPTLAAPWEERAGARATGGPPIVVGPGIRTGMPVRTDNPREVGPTASSTRSPRYALVGGPCIVVDFGTSTNFDVVSADGEFLGGVIAPGIEVSMEALFARAARLGRRRAGRAADGDRHARRSPASSPARCSASPARSTASCAASGPSSAALPDHRDRRAGEPATPHAETLDRHEPGLTLEGRA